MAGHFMVDLRVTVWFPNARQISPRRLAACNTNEEPAGDRVGYSWQGTHHLLMDYGMVMILSCVGQFVPKTLFSGTHPVAIL